jgi:type II secretory pathway pseudopilin PulG
MKFNKIYLLMIQRKKKHQTTEGFLLIEVLVAIVLTLVLTGISMGVVVMATAIKVRGDELSDATRWIQEDIEDIKAKANEIDAVVNTDPVQYTTLTRCSPTGSSNGYADLLMTQARANSLNKSTTNTTGIINASDTFIKTSASGTRNYNLVRTATISTVAPYNTLELTYAVNKTSGTTISNSYAEIIPGASFYCK